jgi:hypothetical protein
VRKRFHVSIFMLALSAVIFSGCDARTESVPAAIHEAEVSAKIDIKMDSALTLEERQLLISDLYQTMQYQLAVAPTSYYAKAFGGADADAAIHYLSERVHYVLPQSVDLGSRLTLASSSLGAQEQQASQIYTMAINVGTALWFEALAQAPVQLGFQVADSVVPLDSPRVGIIQLGQGYTLKKDGKDAFPQLVRVATLIHEARHSDCTGGMVRSDLDLIKQGDLPENRSCGHLHVRCPEGHEYEGAYACDGDAWGAYSIEGLFAAGLVKNCTNCSTADQNVALVIFADSMSRVIPVDDMLAGKLGDPDMTSSTLIHDSTHGPASLLKLFHL